MNVILQELGKSPKFMEYLQNIKQKTSPVVLSGLSDVGKMIVAAGVTEYTKNPICIITYNEIQARKIYEDITCFTDGVVYFPKKEIVTYDYIAESKEILYQRMEVLNNIQYGKVKVVITTIEAVMQAIPKPESMYEYALTLTVGKEYSLERIKEQLVKLGYERYELIDGRGQFSTRGGILDVGISESKGVRIEFWGDEIDSIRYFNISSQRSYEMEKQITINPACEYVLTDNLDTIIQRIQQKEYLSKQTIKVKEDIDYLLTGDYVSKVDKYFDCFYPEHTTLLEYLSQDTIIFYDEINKIKARVENIKLDNENVIKALTEKEKIVPNAIVNMQDFKQIQESNNHMITYLEEQDFNLKLTTNRYTFKTRQVNYYRSSMDAFFTELKQSKHKKTVIYVDTEEKAKKLSLILQEQDIANQYHNNNNLLKEIPEHILLIIVGKLSTGFEDYELNLLVISASELVEGERRKKRRVSSTFKEGEKVVFADLKIGDYVVHKTHGIGQFIGVNTIKADGITKDYIKIKYRGDDMLYIPTNQLDNIRKYVGGGQNAPKVNRLGSKEWSNTKAKVKRNLREVARELIELYAKRQKIKGYAFSKDTPWQKQFEDSFPYQETEDQLRCIDEVKKDMEQAKPMDRLLCGDVGYGKTEVAIRAAFKAIMDQKQVTYLVPTTVLADQQYQSFKERMETFPIRVEVLNRFRTKKQQEDIIRKLKLGEIDVVIGTHRLLSKDVEFKDLGLLIIDEEHRFGVKDKEKIKEYKANVDVLTMTATPIPRTLHMSIVGVRDMSVIYEPPQNRKPVQTYVLEYEQEVIKEAITKELERKGQVFYLFNNVEKIQTKAEEVANLVPEAKVGYAHGKMTGTQLENIMIDFIKGNINVLVCTTILESGIDIPNANTIIVESADRLGLAQLYQIRGRVGRSNIQAYAYITYKRDKLLSEVADKRLKAIKEFTEFGSGFKIAMRDLEIRGAGSLLGEIQHGHMEQVGYDTYCNLLDEVIKEMQGIEVQEEIDVQIDLNVSSYLPDQYIEENAQKIEVYQNIALCRNEEQIQDVIDEMIDRYGPLPEEAENLIEIARIKNLAKKNSVVKILQKPSAIIFTFDNSGFNMDIVDILIKKYRNKIKFSPSSNPYITYKMEALSDHVVLKEIKEFLSNLK